MSVEQLLKLLKEFDGEVSVKETEEKIIIKIKKNSREKNKTLEELGFSFEVGM